MAHSASVGQAKKREFFQQDTQLHFPHLLQIYTYSFSTLEEANSLAVFLASFFPTHLENQVELGLNEIFINAIEHGNLGITSEEKAQLKILNCWEGEIQRRLNDPRNQDKSVEVSLEITPSHICVHVKDQGKGFNWRKTSLPLTNSQKGLGLVLIKNFSFDSVEYSEKGNEIHCSVFLH